MPVLYATPDEIRDTLADLHLKIEGTPVYRMLRDESLAEYREHGVLRPKNGDYAVGTGVFFYLNPMYVLSEKGRLIVVSSVERLSRSGFVDTRMAGYDQQSREQLNMEKGHGNYSGWDIWQRVLENDTITTISGREPIPVFAVRRTVTKDEIDFEVFLKD